MTVFVTGASGMLGANLCRQLVERGYHVRAFTRRPINNPLLDGIPLEQMHGDLDDAARVRSCMAGCTDVFHVAGRISYFDSDEDDLFRTNVLGTRNVVSAAAVQGVRRLVLTSSTAALGGIATEDALAMPATPPFFYGATKAFAEQEALSWSGAIDLVIVNPVTLFGAGDIHRNTGELFRRLRRGKMLLCPPGGTSVLSVSDCAAGHLLAWERGRRGERYILAASNHSYADLFQRIAETVHGTAPRLTIPSAARSLACATGWAIEKAARLLGFRSFSRHFITLGFQKRFYSAVKARNELGWSPKQGLSEMLGEAAEFYLRHALI